MVFKHVTLVHLLTFCGIVMGFCFGVHFHKLNSADQDHVVRGYNTGDHNSTCDRPDVGTVACELRCIDMFYDFGKTLSGCFEDRKSYAYFYNSNTYVSFGE